MRDSKPHICVRTLYKTLFYCTKLYSKAPIIIPCAALVRHSQCRNTNQIRCDNFASWPWSIWAVSRTACPSFCHAFWQLLWLHILLVTAPWLLSQADTFRPSLTISCQTWCASFACPSFLVSAVEPSLSNIFHGNLVSFSEGFLLLTAHQFSHQTHVFFGVMHRMFFQCFFLSFC